MPVGIHIAALPAHGSVGAGASRVSGAPGACSKSNTSSPDVSGAGFAPGAVSESGSGTGPGFASGTASNPDFGALFREQAGPPASVMVGIVPADVKSSAGTGVDAPSARLKGQAAVANPAADSPIEAGQEATTSSDEGMPSSERAILAGSPQVLLEAQLQNQLHASMRGASGATSEKVADAGVDAGGALGGKAGALPPAEKPEAAHEAKTKGDAIKSEASSDAGKQGSTKEPSIVVANNAAGNPLPVVAAAAPAPVAAIASIVPARVAKMDAEQKGASSNPTAASALKALPVKDGVVEASSDAQASTAEGDGTSGVNASQGLKDGGIQVVPVVDVEDGLTPKSSSDVAKAATQPSGAAQHGATASHLAGGAIGIAPSAAAPVTTHADTVSAAPHVSQPAVAAVSAAAPSTSAATATAGTAYDRIDQGAAPVMLHSGAQHVSVGVQDPNLGWVEIKTQNLGGHVDATLVTASGQSHDAIAAQLPAMAQFLEQRDVRVGAITVHHEMPLAGNGAGGGSSGGAGSGTGYGGGGMSYSGGHTGAGTGRESNAPRAGISPAFSQRAAGPFAGTGSEAGSGSGEVAAYRPVSYISVRA